MDATLDDIYSLLGDIVDLLSSDASIASTVALDATQFDQIMMLQTSSLLVLLFILGFLALILGVLLGMCLFKFWRP